MKKIIIRVIAILSILFLIKFGGLIYLASVIFVEFIGSYPRSAICKVELKQYYENDKNIILPDDLVKVEATTGSYGRRSCEYDWKDINVLKSKHLRIETVIYKDEVHKLGEYAYIGNEYLYDKSKGNHFEKIEEYIEKNKEKIYKIFLGDNWKKGINISLKIRLFNKVDNENYYWYNQKFVIDNHLLKRIGEYDDEEYINKKEKEFFKEKVKYEEIDWEKYIPSVGDYPVLVMVVDYENKEKETDKFSIDQDSEKYEKLQEIYKELEKFYNKETFDFIIWE